MERQFNKYDNGQKLKDDEADETEGENRKKCFSKKI
jgi:hypothetical protein